LWFQTLALLDLVECKMPHDVTTQWNSTFNMLAFAILYQSAINNITADKNGNLRKYKLDDDEWKIAVQLHDMLKVHGYPFWKSIPT